MRYLSSVISGVNFSFLQVSQTWDLCVIDVEFVSTHSKIYQLLYQFYIC